MTLVRTVSVALLLGGAASGAIAQPSPADPALVVDREMAAAEKELRRGEFQAAESHYRSALFDGWMLVGTLERLDGKLSAAREAFLSASGSAVEDRPAQQALALVHLQLKEPASAVAILSRMVAMNPRELVPRRLLAQALAADGQTGRAVEVLEEARSLAPADLELAYALGVEYLRSHKPEAAERTFAEVIRNRPIAPTHLLIGRAYSEFREYPRAEAEFASALRLDPRARRAHYYRGLATVADRGLSGIDDAITDFRAELEVSPQDPATCLQLGMALVESQRPEEALACLETAARAPSPPPRTFYYLGRAQLGVQRPAAAVASLERALSLVEGQNATSDQLRAIHNQLGQALREKGDADAAAAHFAEAARLSAQGSEATREQLARYLDETPDPAGTAAPVVPMIEATPLAALSEPQRRDLAGRLRPSLARAYLNLGVMQAQGQRFARAAEFFERVAAVEPTFPQVQSSLGVAYFNARQFDKATASLARALDEDPRDFGLRRMLGLAWLNLEGYDKAADLLRGDPERARNPSLEFAYGLALVKSGRAGEAESVFSSLLRQHGDSAELSVLLGQAHAQLGDFEEAVAALQRALQLDPKVAEANGSLGVIYLKQGRLPEAEAALRAELKVRPADVLSQQNLAIALDQQQKSEEAIPVLRSLLRAKPDAADARYLLGKILLAQGGAAEAVEHLEAAAQLAPGDANVHYQLGQAYQKLGRAAQAQQEFETYRKIKDKR